MMSKEVLRKRKPMEEQVKDALNEMETERCFFDDPNDCAKVQWTLVIIAIVLLIGFCWYLSLEEAEIEEFKPETLYEQKG